MICDHCIQSKAKPTCHMDDGWEIHQILAMQDYCANNGTQTHWHTQWKIWLLEECALLITDRLCGDLGEGWWWRDLKITAWPWKCNAAGKRRAGFTAAWLIFQPYLIVAEHSPYYTLTSGLMMHYILALGLRSRALWVILRGKISYWLGDSVVGVVCLWLFLLILYFNFQVPEVTICRNVQIYEHNSLLQNNGGCWET